jgi:hypothetical protein
MSQQPRRIYPPDAATERGRRERARFEANVTTALDRLLVADAVARADLIPLARGPKWAVAASTLQRIADYGPHLDGPLTVLLDRANAPLRVSRLAVAVGVARTLDDPMSLADLRARALGRGERAHAARIALALLGDRDWLTADRRERAACLLGHLATLHLEGAAG